MPQSCGLWIPLSTRGRSIVFLGVSWVPGGSSSNLPAKPETQVQSLGGEDPPEKGMATR